MQGEKHKKKQSVGYGGMWEPVFAAVKRYNFLVVTLSLTVATIPGEGTCCVIWGTNIHTLPHLE